MLSRSVESPCLIPEYTAFPFTPACPSPPPSRVAFPCSKQASLSPYQLCVHNSSRPSETPRINLLNLLSPCNLIFAPSSLEPHNTNINIVVPPVPPSRPAPRICPCPCSQTAALGHVHKPIPA